MSGLGPFGPAPTLAVAVSGGPDSLALALLAAAWARARGGEATALIVDHGLRAASAAEAALTAQRLAIVRIASRILTLADLAPGPALADRARRARHTALEAACREAGIVHLLFGHHAADQAETLLMRHLSGSGPAGLAGMAALTETHGIRRLRPLLRIPAARLRATLQAAGLDWIEDPSNTDPAALRARIRALRADPTGAHPATTTLTEIAAAQARARAATDAAIAAELAARAELRPQGYGRLTPGPIAPESLAALLRTLSGRPYGPAPAQVAALAAGLRPATIAGVRILRAGPDFLLAREPAAMAPPVPARQGAVWDHRFRLASPIGENLTLGALGPDAARLRRLSPLPAAVLRTLPALRRGEELVTVPHLSYATDGSDPCTQIVFSPPSPAAGAPFRGA